MESVLIIGCKSCYEEVKKKRGYTINSEGLLRIPVIVNTAYKIHDLYELFIQNYTCPFCNRILDFSPNIMEFTNDFINKKYHIIFNPNSIEIISHERIIFTPQQDFKEIENLLSSKNPEYYPTPDEMKLILKVTDDLDTNQWFFYMQSAHVSPYFVKHSP